MRQVIYNYPGPKRRPNQMAGERPWRGGKFFRAVLALCPAHVVAEHEDGTVDLVAINPDGQTERRNGVPSGDTADTFLEGADFEAAMAAKAEAEANRLEKEAADLAAKAAAARARLKK